MTEDSSSRTRGYGPFPEGADPTAPIPAQPTGVEQQAYAAPAPDDSAPATGQAATSQTSAGHGIGPASSPNAIVPPSAQNGETPLAYPLPPAQPANPIQVGPAQAAPTQAAPTQAHPEPSQRALPDQVIPNQVAPDQFAPAQTPPAEAFSPQPVYGQPYGQTPGFHPSGIGPSTYQDQPTTANYPQASSESGQPIPDQPRPSGSGAQDYDPDTTYPLQPTTPYPSGAYPQSPYPPAPTSGTPTSGTPTSGTPTSSGAPSYGPFRSAPTPDPLDFTSPAPFSNRRIEPSPPPDRSRLIIGLVAGLLAGLLLFGIGGFFTGRATAPDAAPRPTASDAPSAPKTGVFEQSQIALNQPHFAGTGLVTISQGWLPYISTCSRSGEPGGPKLNAGEKTRVRCTLNGMSAFFVEYNDVAARDAARDNTLKQNVDARTLTPGVGAAKQGPTPSGRTTGNYVEYAYKLTEGGVTRPVAAIWWDDAQAPVAGYLLAYWKEGLGESWDPMRDLWSRYA